MLTAVDEKLFQVFNQTDQSKCQHVQTWDHNEQSTVLSPLSHVRTMGCQLIVALHDIINIAFTFHFSMRKVISWYGSVKSTYSPGHAFWWGQSKLTFELHGAVPGTLACWSRPPMILRSHCHDPGKRSLKLVYEFWSGHDDQSVTYFCCLDI